ncbi:hypothetical protein PG985_011346 [Apiospora marii]|uniref:PRA1 family protein n=1 Tax=Apiospora marii TaxID=335849 RepID=A0ABR1STG2_9PEZI
MGQQSKKPITVTRKLEAFRRWAKLKQYQIEVTYAVNTYTPLEKVFFYSLVLALFALSATGFAFYLFPPIVNLVCCAWNLLSHDVPLIASHIGAANKMVRESPNGPVASPLESYAMSL